MKVTDINEYRRRSKVKVKDPEWPTDWLGFCALTMYDRAVLWNIHRKCDPDKHAKLMRARYYE